MDNCLFCEIYKNKKEVIYENGLFFFRFDKFPVSPGHSQVIPVRHIESLFDLTNREWMSLQEALTHSKQLLRHAKHEKIYNKILKNPPNEKSAQFCRKMLEHIGLDQKPDGYNIGVNEGRAAGRTINHLHIQIIPRYFGDVKDPTGGIRHVITGMGNYKK